MKEEDFDQLFKEKESLEENRQKRIIKGVRVNIYKRIVIALIVIALIVVGLMKGSSYIFDGIYYSPFREDEMVVNDVNSDTRDDTFHIVFQTYCQVFFPGIDYCPIDDIESQGFGSYKCQAKIHRLFDRLNVDGESNLTLKIEQSRMHMETIEKYIFSRVSEEFYNRSRDLGTDVFKINQSTLNDIDDLPDSSRLNVSISFPKAYSLQESIQFMNKYQNMSCYWMAIDKFSTKYNDAYGISMWKAFRYDLLPEVSKQYPNFYINDNKTLTPQILQQYYLSQLQLLLDHPKEVEMIAEMLTSGVDFNIYDVQELYDYVKNGFDVVGFRMNVGKKELLKIIEEEKIEYMYIDDVKLSILQK